MKAQNYASLEASKRLIDVGIVLETDMYFRVFDKEIAFISSWQKKCWENEIKVDAASDEVVFIPAPSMVEVWIELPDGIELNKNGVVYASIESDEGFYKEFISANPTDALIDLLIWVRKDMTNEQKTIFCVIT